MISINPESRFHRIVKKMDRCQSVGLQDLPDCIGALIAEGDSLLGIYKGDSPVEDIVFTSQAVIFTESGKALVRKLLYKEVLTVDFPLPASDATELVLGLRDSLVVVNVVGRQGTYRDVFEMGRFFMRIVEDRLK